MKITENIFNNSLLFIENQIDIIDIYLGLGIFFSLFLFVLSTLISSSEFAYFSLTKNDIEKIKSSKVKNKNTIIKLLESPKYLISTILITNIFINIGIIILSTYITSIILNGKFYLYVYIIQILVITLLMLFMGKIIPKGYASKHKLKLASLSAKPVYILNKIFYPLNKIIVSTTSIIDNIIEKTNIINNNLTVDEISKALEITATNKNNDQENILKSIINFGQIEVTEIMKSRLDIIAFDENTPFKELLQNALNSGYSRFPIYKKNFDTVIGILHIKDLIDHTDKDDDFKWNSLMRKPYFIPENKKLDDLLKEFQQKKTHIAIIVDEYGGTSGIVTLEDILEEIVGEIDEDDDTNTLFKKIDENNYTFEAKISLNDFSKILGINSNVFDNYTEHCDSIGGFILELKGEIPNIGDTFYFHNFIFKIEDSNNRKINKILVTIK